MPITKDNSTEDIAAKLTNPTFRLARRPFEENNSSHLPTVDTIEFIRKEETQVLNPFYRRHHLEKRSVRCNYCKALMYIEESSAGSKKLNTLKFSNCCAKGKVSLPPANPLRDLIINYLTNDEKDNKEGQQFRANNSAQRAELVKTMVCWSGCYLCQRAEKNVIFVCSRFQKFNFYHLLFKLLVCSAKLKTYSIFLAFVDSVIYYYIKNLITFNSLFGLQSQILMLRKNV